jgi:hypothetical protein
MSTFGGLREASKLIGWYASLAASVKHDFA